ncbi:TPA: conjugal transfer protein [Streptococcus pneumoniae]
MDGKVEKQEVKANEVLKEVKEEYDKAIVNLEDNTNTQLKIAEELKKELKNNDFDANIEELKSLKEEILGLKSEIKRLNELERITFSSLILRDIKNIGNTLVTLQNKAVDSMKSLYANMKYQFSYNLTKAQEKLVQAKISIVKNLVSSMQDFIKDQQKKLNVCLEKLDSLSEEIKKDEKEFFVEKNRDKTDKKEVEVGTKKEEVIKKEKVLEKSKSQKVENKPSVLKMLKENQQKIKNSEKTKEEKTIKKDKGMEI